VLTVLRRDGRVCPQAGGAEYLKLMTDGIIDLGLEQPKRDVLTEGVQLVVELEVLKVDLAPG
jgi:hypothetical protein